MNLFKNLHDKYTKDTMRASQAQELALQIAFAPMVFQVSRLMVKFGVFELLLTHKEGKTLEEVAEHCQISEYASKILLEASLTIGTVYINEENRYFLAKAGYFLLKDQMVKVNMEFNHDVNYLGLFHLEEALKEGKPSGLKVFGEWPTIYEGLSELPKDVQKSWFGFDHFYSDSSFQQALELIFDTPNKGVKTLLDVGGNTGRWASRCVAHNQDVDVTIMDLPQQIAMAQQALSGIDGFERIHYYGANLLDDACRFPAERFDIIWMSQFLDCFSMEEIISIISRAKESMDEHSRLCIMETLWDRQEFAPASYSLTLTSVYFTALANGNSKMYHTDDLSECITRAGLEIETIHDGLGFGHSIVVCKKAQA